MMKYGYDFEAVIFDQSTAVKFYFCRIVINYLFGLGGLPGVWIHALKFEN